MTLKFTKAPVADRTSLHSGHDQPAAVAPAPEPGRVKVAAAVAKYSLKVGLPVMRSKALKPQVDTPPAAEPETPPPPSIGTKIFRESVEARAKKPAKPPTVYFMRPLGDKSLIPMPDIASRKAAGGQSAVRRVFGEKRSKASESAGNASASSAAPRTTNKPPKAKPSASLKPEGMGVQALAGILLASAAESVLTAPSNHPTTTIWQRLKQKFRNAKPNYLPPSTVDDNGAKLPCIAETSVLVLDRGQELTPHANHIDLRDLSTTELADFDTKGGRQPGLRSAVLGRVTPSADKERIFVAGQSPLRFARRDPQRASPTEKVLIAAITKRQGTFQIVSERVHAGTTDIDNASPAGSIDPLIKQLLKRTSNDIGNSYEIVAMEPVKSQESDYLCYILTVRDKIKGGEIQVPLTQVGMPYDDAVLRGPAIRQAFWRLNGHTAVNQKIDPARPARPFVISQVGVGRNATVIVYHAIHAMLQSGEVETPEALDIALENAVAEGRAARGPDFIKSEAQLHELRTALHELLAESLALRDSGHEAQAGGK